MHGTYTGAAAKGQAQTFTSLLGLYLVGCSDLAVLQLNSNLLTISSARAEACVLSRDVQGAWERELQATRATENVLQGTCTGKIWTMWTSWLARWEQHQPIGTKDGGIILAEVLARFNSLIV